MDEKSAPVLLVLGKNGQVGFELVRALAPVGRVVALDRAGLDLTDAQAIRDKIGEIAPDAVFNAAAYTAVDRAQDEPELAIKINKVAPSIIAEESARAGAFLVHYSTDYVFDGKKKSAYREGDATAPINVYGETKLAGEKAVRAVGGAHVVLRTSWVYSARGSNFLLTMLRLMKERESLSIVADQIGAPTWARNVAEISGKVAKQALLSQNHREFPEKLLHLSPSGHTSWYGFGEKIAKVYRQQFPDRELRVRDILPIGSDDYPTKAKRPKNSRLDCSRLENALGIMMPDWEAGVEMCIAEMGEGEGW